ncbi:uncharacterized protein RMCC_2537 [Mycolicibacterium canariasense]|uniref:Uncharacterized protein n=1 Tax=Mycolicibacterium canariasense TaxID=228230 RepID=A0A100WCE4_MYCCR|nr:uncharacterized protein RMCC_2537 [Mycolicibacterium canariasense]
MLAEGAIASWIGPAARAVAFTAAGVALTVLGVVRRSDRMRWDRADDSRLLHPDRTAPTDDLRLPRPRSGGTGFIVGGTVLLLLGLLHILDFIATLHNSGVI